MNFLDIIVHMKWLKKNNKPLSEVQKRWEATHSHRINVFRTDSHDNILEDWPILGSDLCPTLVNSIKIFVPSAHEKCQFIFTFL